LQPSSVGTPQRGVGKRWSWPNHGINHCVISVIDLLCLSFTGSPIHPPSRCSQFPRRSSAIIHRTVRCTSGATAICAQRSTMQSEQWNPDVRAASQRGTGLSSVPPDCPVPHEDKASNGRPAPTLTDRMTWRRTGHWLVAHRTLSDGAPDCPVRPSPAHFTNG
jgi:hypothetical protein